jgi:hypothetical protein
MCSILNDLKCYASITSSFRSHISNVKGKKKKKKKNKRNKLSNLQNTFFLFFLFEPLLLSNLVTFLFLLHFKWLKVL